MTMIKGIKGFDSNLQCRGFKFEVGQTYTHDGQVAACKSGFHAVPDDVHPLAVFDFYPPAGSRFCLVEVGGKTEREDNKIAAEILTVVREIGLADLAVEAVKWVMARSTPEGESAASATGYQGAASATGDWGAASATGVQGAASATGVRGAASATGEQGAASATGYQGAASATGDWGAASATGVQGAASATGYQGAASATGEQGAASATGYQGAASATGDWGAASAGHATSCAFAAGYMGTASGVTGSAICAVERSDDGAILSIASGIVGRDGIKPGVAYRCQGGKLVEAWE